MIQRNQFMALGWVLACSAFVTSNLSAQTSNRGGNVSDDLLAVYEQTKSAKSETEVTSIARVCAKIIPSSSRSQVDRDYASNLLAWALNRRGEMRNEAAATLVEQGKFDEAQKLDKLAAEDYATAIKYGKPNWRTHHNYAIALAMQGSYEKAIAQFDTAIELKPDYANAYFNRGELYFETSEYTQAIADYDEAIKLKDQDPQFFNSRAHSYFLLEQFDQSVADYKRATELAGDSVTYQTDLADAYQYLGKWELAAEAYRDAIAIDNQYARAYQNAAWLMATCPDERYRKPELALSAAKRAIAIVGKQTPRLLDTLAAASAALGKFNDAAKLSGDAIKLAPPEEKPELSERLALYQKRVAYLQPTASTSRAGSSEIRTASGAQQNR